MSSTAHLLTCSLLPGQRVRVGRKARLEITVNRPYLSSLHFQVNMSSHESGYRCRVLDHSYNGTWFLPAGSTELGEAVRLTKGERRDLTCGDTLLLVSPHHVHCEELMFTLEQGKREGECILRQLPSAHYLSQKQGIKRKRSDSSDSATVKMTKLNAEVESSTPVGRTVPKTPPTSPTHLDNLTVELESCPHCIQLFPVDGLPAHVDLCPLAHPSVDQCPLCGGVYPLTELVIHVDTCSGGSKCEEEVALSGRRYSLEAYGEPTMSNVTVPVGDTEVDGAVPLGDTEVDGAVPAGDTEVDGAVRVKAMDNNKSTFEANLTPYHEHCQHCLGLFLLDQLVDHSLSCFHHKGLHSGSECEGGSQGEPIERCMHCFMDFPLSRIVNHSNSCQGDMLGPRERFTGFLPSVHDMDSMALSVLTDTQLAAVQHVVDRSKLESESVYSDLRRRVVSLGYSERDLENTLNWVRRDAPIIIHVSLDRVLPFLVSDTHYRNLFEVGTGRGTTNISSRSAWEDRMFNRLYASSCPEERVKYGVLNIVGDPRGVQSCYSYGDSFLQLKKVRLRTTFASADTSLHTVQLSCCEHYGNVLNKYSQAELQAILDIATRKYPFLRSNVISQYKEVQIHGPVCLSENVDCIVVNERHIGDSTITDLLERFVERNKCNLLWMDPIESVGYPALDLPPLVPPLIPTETFPPSLPAVAEALPRDRRRCRRKRGRRAYEGY